MKYLSIIIGVFALLTMFVALIPCLGSINWINIPFAGVGLILGILAYRNPEDPDKLLSLIGMGICGATMVIGAIRLLLGGGII